MLTRTTIAAVAACVVAAAAPTAHSSHATFDCDLHAIANETVTGGQDTFTGMVAGYIVGTPGEAVAIRCVVYVDGVEVSGTPTGTGTTAAVTAGQVTFVAPGGQNLTFAAQEESQVLLCGEWTAGTETGTTCHGTTCVTWPDNAACVYRG